MIVIADSSPLNYVIPIECMEVLAPLYTLYTASIRQRGFIR